MKTEFIEAYSKLKDLKPGQVAISKDRSSFFVCGFVHDGIESFAVFLDLNNLYNQYVDKIDLEQPVKILESGDKFVCER